MKQKSLSVMGVIAFFTGFYLASGGMATSAFADEMNEPEGKISEVGQVLSNLGLSGGVSGGYFFASNPGEDTSGSEFLLSNLLVEISYAEEALPMGFVAAFGETSTPSVLDAPENNRTLSIEYAGILVSPTADLILEVGLLGPNSGFENTYTYDNSNILLGAVASQQPYNAYGVKFGYETGGLLFWGGYYKERLDDEEYNAADEAWEIGVGGEFLGNDVGLYHYHVGGSRHLTGVVIERSIQEMAVGFNVDYWTRDDAMAASYGSDTALGGAVYICQTFGNVSIPFRIEYIRQDESGIYIENAGTDSIFTATITPTYHFSENAYARAEVAYVAADQGFADDDGDSKDSNMGLAVEFGVTF